MAAAWRQIFLVALLGPVFAQGLCNSRTCNPLGSLAWNELLVLAWADLSKSVISRTNGRRGSGDRVIAEVPPCSPLSALSWLRDTRIANWKRRCD